MRISKKVISDLTKCYAVAPLKYQGADCFLVAAEKADKCLLFDSEGNILDTVWEEPGGVMSMVQVPESEGQFIATHKFYSPNDSKEAKLVLVTPETKGCWKVETLAELPFVHRFDILQRDGSYYLIACTLKSGHEYNGDWSMPGKVYAAKLPKDLSRIKELKLEVIKKDLLKNHGFSRLEENGYDSAVISCENGVFRFEPPKEGKWEWTIEQLIDEPASDAVLVDFDEDGKKELATISPFHGEKITIYKETDGKYQPVYYCKEALEFSHAIYGGVLCGRPTLVIGHREGKKNIIAFTYQKDTKTYQTEIIDENCGAANVFHYMKNGKDILIVTNREINQVAMYTLEK